MSRTRPAGMNVTSRRFSINRTGTVGSPARTSSLRADGGGGMSSGGPASGGSGAGATVTTGGGAGGGVRAGGRDAAHPARARVNSHAPATPVPLGRVTSGKRRHPDSNRGMRVLQTLALPLGDGARSDRGFVGHGRCTGQGMAG